eukprot:gnl/Carplike_NY0171/4868_a6637_314.p1 GENE.gnl/Carplike_NY0171/4868_a6637_314~~gnl/Carplike_NY0171/4868_a6637_314.p1  ORF type:complete len:378 (-),score=80.46 gnl/Carplike_NY0171/4868_a6637_314:120-1253(-)
MQEWIITLQNPKSDDSDMKKALETGLIYVKALPIEKEYAIEMEKAFKELFTIRTFKFFESQASLSLMAIIIVELWISSSVFDSKPVKQNISSSFFEFDETLESSVDISFLAAASTFLCFSVHYKRAIKCISNIITTFPTSFRDFILDGLLDLLLRSSPTKLAIRYCLLAIQSIIALEERLKRIEFGSFLMSLEERILQSFCSLTSFSQPNYTLPAIGVILCYICNRATSLESSDEVQSECVSVLVAALEDVSENGEEDDDKEGKSDQDSYLSPTSTLMTAISLSTSLLSLVKLIVPHLSIFVVRGLCGELCTAVFNGNVDFFVGQSVIDILVAADSCRGKDIRGIEGQEHSHGHLGEASIDLDLVYGSIVDELMPAP